MCTAFSTSVYIWHRVALTSSWVNVSHKGCVKDWLHGIRQLSFHLRCFLWKSDGKQWGRRHCLVPLCFSCRTTFSIWSCWMSGWLIFTYGSTVTAHTNWGKDSTSFWALDLSPKSNFCAFGLEARSPETLILALTMIWVTSVGKSFWARSPEGFWCFVGCWRTMHNPDKCTVSEPRMGFGRGSTLNGDVA